MQHRQRQYIGPNGDLSPEAPGPGTAHRLADDDAHVLPDPRRARGAALAVHRGPEDDRGDAAPQPSRDTGSIARSCVQYGRFLANVASGNLGDSFTYRRARERRSCRRASAHPAADGHRDRARLRRGNRARHSPGRARRRMVRPAHAAASRCSLRRCRTSGSPFWPCWSSPDHGFRFPGSARRR